MIGPSVIEILRFQVESIASVTQTCHRAYVLHADAVVSHVEILVFIPHSALSAVSYMPAPARANLLVRLILGVSCNISWLWYA
jgi:hypothetical protein